MKDGSVPIKLRPDQTLHIDAMEQAIANVASTDYYTDTVTLATLKARCEEFLNWPIIKALNTEGL